MPRTKSVPNSLKLQIVKSYLQGKKPISDLSKEHNLNPSQIYLWVSQLFDNGERCFQRKNDRHTGEGATKRSEAAVAELKDKLANKNTVISELMEELLVAKKLFGTLNQKSGSLQKPATKL